MSLVKQGNDILSVYQEGRTVRGILSGVALQDSKSEPDHRLVTPVRPLTRASNSIQSNEK